MDTVNTPQRSVNCSSPPLNATVVDSQYSSASQLILLGCFSGLFTGLIEILLFEIGQSLDFVLHYQYNRNALWIKPTSSLIPCVIISILAALVSRMVVGKNYRTAFSVCVFLFAAYFFLMVESFVNLIFDVKIADWCKFILIGGVSYNLTRLLVKVPARFKVLVKWSTPVLAVVVILLNAIEFGARFLNERKAVRLIEAKESDSPNIILAVFDTVRAKNLSVYGHLRETSPTMEGIAKDGIVFNCAIAPSSWTLPVHASLFTGKYCHELRADTTIPLDPSYPTLAEVLQENGYVTIGSVANHFFAGSQTGLSKGFIYYYDYPTSWGEYFRMTWYGWLCFRRDSCRFCCGMTDLPGRKSADEVNEAAIRTLDRHPKKPFFLFLNYLDAHDPYLPHDGFDFSGLGGNAPFQKQMATYRMRAMYSKVSELETGLALQAYDSGIRFADYQFGLLLQEIDRRNQLENTLIVVVADHGEQFGEHNLFNHGTSLHSPQVRVPLIFSKSDLNPMERRIGTPISLRDVPATILKIIGIGNESIPGESLDAHWNQGEATTSVALSYLAKHKEGGLPPNYPTKYGPIRSIWMDGKQYIQEQFKMREELYDYENDPDEMNNLAMDKKFENTLKELRKKLDELMPLSKP